MKLSHVIDAVYNKPWLITPSTHAAIRELVDAHVLGKSQFVPLGMREGTGVCGDAIDLEQMEIVDGIAHIPIGGVIGRKLTSFERGSGAVDSDDIAMELEQAEADETVKAILLDIDSPGGMVNGTPELAELISQLSKPVYAFCAGGMNSAAYWIGAVCEAIFITKSAEVGSIGVYVPWLDSSEAHKMHGVSVDVISSGTFKGMGYPGTSLTDAQRAELQSSVDRIAAQFKAHVRECRGDIAGSAMQGQTFDAEDALALGLVDYIVSGKREVIESLI